MTGDWVMLVNLSQGDGVMVAYFASEELCRAALDRLAEVAQGWDRYRSFGVCVPVR